MIGFSLDTKKREGQTFPTLLFLLSPPRAGSTAIAEVLNSSKQVAFLQARAEGQWLTKQLATKQRWSRDYTPNYSIVKKVWSKRILEIVSFDPMCKIIFEKSPPNLMRIEHLASIFPKNFIFATNRDPYAWVGSTMRRAHQNSELNRQAEKYFNPDEKSVYRKNAPIRSVRPVLVKAFTRQWIDIASEIKRVTTKMALDVVTYEALTASPTILLDIMPADIRTLLLDLDLAREIQVKDHPSGAFKNKNAESIANLSTDDLIEISGELSANESLLRYFGYQLLNHDSPGQ